MPRTSGLFACPASPSSKTTSVAAAGDEVSIKSKSPQQAPTSVILLGKSFFSPLISSRPRMRPVVDLADARPRDVSIDLGRGDVRVAEHHLNGPEVGVVVDEMRGERVRQDVGSEGGRPAFRDAAFSARKTVWRVIGFPRAPGNTHRPTAPGFPAPTDCR